MAEKEKYRITIGTFDLAKGLLVIMIILGHKLYNYAVDPAKVFAPIIPLSVLFRYGGNPLFFIVCGFSFKQQPAKKMLKKSFSDLLKPYLYVMLACAVCFPLIHYAAYRWWPGALSESTRFFLAFLLGIAEPGKVVLGYELYWCSVTWFFLALFLAQNILNLILKIPNEKVRGLAALGCAIAGYALSQMEFNYFCIHQGLLGTGYCYIGYLIKKQKFYQNKYIPWICIGLTVVSVVHVIFGSYDMAYGIYKYGFLECILAGASGVLASFLCIMTSHCDWRILDPVKTIGMYSYWIICVHAVETVCIPWYLWSAKMAERPYLGFWLEVAMSAGLFAIVCAGIKKITKYRNNRRFRRMK